MGKGITKSALAKELKWSRTRLDHRLAEDAAFPVLEKARGRNGWRFDLSAVKAHLRGTDAKKSAEHKGEATARQRRDSVQAEMLEDQLRMRRGELLERGPTVAVVSQAMVNLGKGLDSLPERIVRSLGLPEAVAPKLRNMVDDVRKSLAADLRQLAA